MVGTRVFIRIELKRIAAVSCKRDYKHNIEFLKTYDLCSFNLFIYYVLPTDTIENFSGGGAITTSGARNSNECRQMDDDASAPGVL